MIKGELEQATENAKAKLFRANNFALQKRMIILNR